MTDHIAGTEASLQRPGSKLKLGLVGFGRIGCMHAFIISEHVKNIEITGVADPLIDTAADRLKELGIEKATNDYRQLLNDNLVDAVLISTPTSTHSRIIMEAAERGKHIFCEKPIDFDINKAFKAVEVAEKCGIQLQLGFNRRFDSNNLYMHDQVANGHIGKLNYIKITTKDTGTINLDYLKTSGGIFMDMMIHDFDMARYLGCSEIKEVYAMGAARVDSRVGEIDDVDTSIVSYKYQDGALGTIDICRHTNCGFDHRIEVFGSERTLVSENKTDNSVFVGDSGGVRKSGLYGTWIDRFEQSFITQLKDFSDSLLNDKPVSANGKDGLQAIAIAQAALESMKRNRPVLVEQLI